MQLQWKNGRPIGVVRIECSTFCPLDEQMIVLVHSVAPVLLAAVYRTEQMNIGDEPPLGSKQLMLRAYDEQRKQLPQDLEAEMQYQARARARAPNPTYAARLARAP